MKDAISRAEQLYVLALYDGGQFTFDKLVPWLRKHVVTARPKAVRNCTAKHAECYGVLGRCYP
jgi:hypothetical protein